MSSSVGAITGPLDESQQLGELGVLQTFVEQCPVVAQRRTETVGAGENVDDLVQVCSRRVESRVTMPARGRG